MCLGLGAKKICEAGCNVGNNLSKFPSGFLCSSPKKLNLGSTGCPRPLLFLLAIPVSLIHYR